MKDVYKGIFLWILAFFLGSIVWFIGFENNILLTLLSLIIVVPLVTEVLFFFDLMMSKGDSDNYSVKKNKSLMFGFSFAIIIISCIPFFIIKYLIKEFDKISNFVYEYRIYVIIGTILALMIPHIIKWLIILFNWWLRFNKKMAIKELGKKRVKP